MSDKRPARVRLAKDVARHVRGGHPWIWRDALAPAPLESGDVVDVVDASGAFLARGLWDSRSPIAVRVFSLDARESVSAGLFSRRVQEALAAREGAIDHAETNAFRLLNGEGDSLPGFVCDLYRDTAVVRFDGDFARARTDWLVDAIRRAIPKIPIRRIYERSRGAAGQVLWGDEPPDLVMVRESGFELAVDVKRGQKTGTFLDQRENRRAIARYCKGVEVANLFAYTGGFSLHAARAGARRVTSVDSAAPALSAARDAFARNGMDPSNHRFDCEDAFAWLARARAEGRRYGLMVVDPPSFAPSQKSLDKARAAYRDLFAASLERLEENGLLCAASCSSHVDLEAFLGTLRDAGLRARRSLRILEIRGQPPDHPTTPAFKEGRYLKFVVCRVL